MDRTLWTLSVTEASCPAWICPTCKKGTIALVPKSLVRKETVASERAHGHSDWDPDWISLVFTAWGQCSHPQCKEQFAISGKGGVEASYDSDGDVDWSDYFTPISISPMPDIIQIPAACPEEVMSELKGAFALFHSNQPACAGRIRVSLENLMDHLNVPRKKKDKNGKFSELSLHKRIDAYAQTDPSAGTQLMALKRLGNSGSHTSSMSKSDLLDAFEIMEHALAELIDKRTARVAALAKKLSKKHR